MTTVFRIETPDGKGICFYNSKVCDAYHKKCHDENESSATEWPGQEFQAIYRTCALHQNFAFASLEALKMWFPQTVGRADMKAEGAMIVEYDVNDILSNGSQVIFNKHKAVRGNTRDLETLEVVNG